MRGGSSALVLLENKRMTMSELSDGSHLNKIRSTEFCAYMYVDMMAPNSPQQLDIVSPAIPNAGITLQAFPIVELLSS